MIKYTKEDVLGTECRFVVQIPLPEGYEDEYHLVKTAVHLKDGTILPRVRFIKNFKREFWITRDGMRNHKDKKEQEEISNCQRYETRQCDLVMSVQRALGVFQKRPDLRKLSNSPYLYGTDVLSTTIIKHGYAKKYPDLQSPFTVAGFDVETDVLNGTEQVVLASITMGSKAYTAVTADFAKGYPSYPTLARKAAEKYLGKLIDERKIDWEVVVVENAMAAVEGCFKRAHEWQPDLLEIWNINFDIPKVIEMCNIYGVDPADLFSDPRVPTDYRFYHYKEGPKQKVTASGKITPIKIADQWHTLFCPASFYVIDGMCVYRKLRVHLGDEPSHSLDAILKKEGFDGKLNFKEADGYSKKDWHVFMQRNYPVEYAVYNLYDCVCMEQLDEKIQDLRISFPMAAGQSDFANFKSQPRRTVDDLHFESLEDGLVYASTGDEMATELDTLTIGVKDWIITLKAELVSDNGLKCIKNRPKLSTNIRTHVADLDVSASYPNGGIVFNISRGTTAKELCSINGVRETVRRRQGINLSGGHSNAIEVCQEMFSMPKMDEMLAAFMESESN